MANVGAAREYHEMGTKRLEGPLSLPKKGPILGLANWGFEMQAEKEPSERRNDLERRSSLTGTADYLSPEVCQLTTCTMFAPCNNLDV